MFNRFENYPSHQKLITPSDSAPLATEMIIYCGTSGTIKVADAFGAEITYTVSAGEVLPVLVNKVFATGTTVTQIVGLY